MRLPLYIYSNRNIAGSVLGLASLAAYFSGAIHEFWYLIVAGSYGIGALAARDSSLLETTINDQMNVKDAVDAVQRLAAEAQKSFRPTSLRLSFRSPRR